jgi:hypothetical protein
MPKQAALILPGPDWIQLTNINRKMEKHKDMLLLTKTTIAGQTLDGVEKVVVVGHGLKAPSVMQGITPVELADLISKTNFKKGKLRLDTCYSAYDGIVAAAPLVAAELKKKNLKEIVVSGTVGPSITGWDSKRGVVKDDSFAEDVLMVIQGTLEIVHDAKLTEAKESADKWKENASSVEIAALATEVAAKTKPFFNDFLKVLNSPVFSGIMKKKNYKAYFDTAD